MITVNDLDAIRVLKERGYSVRRIARDLEIHRSTVTQYCEKIEAGATRPKRVAVSSILDPFTNDIRAAVEDGKSATQIYQDLAQRDGFSASYPTVRRAVAKILDRQPETYQRMVFAPAEEAQIDFGLVGTVEVDGKSRKLWLFVMTLCFSRLAYYDLVLDQTVPTFLSAIRRGFEYFGAVPKQLKPDNLKSAVLIDKLGQRYYQDDFRRFCRHYGTIPSAARPYTPTDKGRVERDIRYAKGNCFQGYTFKTFDQAQAHLVRWREKVANVRVHRTTNRQPLRRYRDQERPHMLPLPAEPFDICTVRKYKVRKDCHISVEGNFYSVPYRLVGREVIGRIGERTVTIMKDDAVVARHKRAEGRGHDVTRKEHYPREKRIPTQEIHRRRMMKVRKAGPHAAQYMGFIAEGDFVIGDQVAHFACLIDQYGADTVDRACARALYFKASDGAVVIQRILNYGLQDLPLDPERESGNQRPTDGSHDFGRPLTEYGNILKLVADGVTNGGIDDDTGTDSDQEVA